MNNTANPIYNSFNELAQANTTPEFQDQSVWNMATIQHFNNTPGCRKGFKLVVGSRDHGSPHVEALGANRQFIAKIFIESDTVKDENAVRLDPSRDSYFKGREEDVAMSYLKDPKNLDDAKKEWNRVHKHNPAAKPATGLITTEDKNETITGSPTQT